MSLLDTLRSGVAIANSVTRPLQAVVSYQQSLGQDAYGEPILGPVVPMHAICDWRQKQLRTMSGQLSVSRVSVLFLDINEMVAATNGEGIDDDDIVVLPDGTTGPILDMAGFIDAGTGAPLATEVFLG